MRGKVPRVSPPVGPALPAELGSVTSLGAAGRRDGMRCRCSGEEVGIAEAETEAGRPIAAALAPGMWREMLEALREGGPWKSVGGGRRAEEEEGPLVDSGVCFCF